MTGAGVASPVSRVPVAAFSVLVAATVAAFFITQHLKVTTPLIAGFPRPVPAVINPVDGRTCGGVDHRTMRISFYLLHRSDDVDVYVVDRGGAIVRTLASGLYMRAGQHPVRKFFVWNGREDNGTLAPEGAYYVRVALVHQGRTVTISDASGPVPVKIRVHPPAPRIVSVTPRVLSYGARAAVTIRYSGNENRGGTVLISRIGANGRANVVKSFLTPWHGQSAVWDGLVRKQPAPSGAYRIALQVTDAACNTGTSAPVAVAVR
jgi:hypothetical protein